MSRWDILTLVGVALVAIGTGLIYLPAGVIMFGAGVTAFGVIGAVADGRSAGDKRSPTRSGKP